jgi:hypothetical protein
MEQAGGEWRKGRRPRSRTNTSRASGLLTLISMGRGAFRRCCAPGEGLYALDGQPTCYSLEPHQQTDALSPFAWPVPAFPDRDYHIFLAADLRFGVFAILASRRCACSGKRCCSRWRSSDRNCFHGWFASTDCPQPTSRSIQLARYVRKPAR